VHAAADGPGEARSPVGIGGPARAPRPLALPRPPRPKRRDYGRVLAIIVSALFALVGLVPLGLGLLVRTELVRSWAARETAALLARELGITARYRVTVEAWPMLVALDDLVVDGTDGPFLSVERVAVRPRVFSLLAAELDAGDIEVVGPRVHAVVRRGELVNLRLPPRSGGEAPTRPPSHRPFASIAVTDARLDVTVDDLRVTTEELDADVSTDDPGAFEIALRAGTTKVVRKHPFVGREAEEDAVDEDVVCRLDGRVRVEPGSVLVRRLALAGSLDVDPDPGTMPSCALGADDWRRVELRVGSLRVGRAPDAPPTVSGRAHAKLPAAVVHRIVDAPAATGSVTLDVDAAWDGRARLPTVRGTLVADLPGVAGKVFSSHVEATLDVANDVVHVTNLAAHWADGLVTIPDVRIEPFEKGIPLHAGPVGLHGLELAGLLRDLAAHPRPHVGMALREGSIEHFDGTLAPLSLEGPLVVKTQGFGIYDKPTFDPTRHTMMGVKEGTVRCSFQVQKDAVVFHRATIDTPRSHIGATVALQYRGYIDLEAYEGTRVDLADISPVVDIPMGGVATIRADMHGPFEHPHLVGDLGLDRYVLGGFSVGELEAGKVSFEPLVLTIESGRLKHGASRAKVHARLDFDGPANVKVDADVDSREAPHFALRDLFEVFHFDKDPRWAGVAATAAGTARVHYALGGPEDRCGGGALDVRAQMALPEAEAFGERYTDGDLDLDFAWDDQAAGAAGLRVDLRSLSLRKGKGNVLARLDVAHGAKVRGSAILTRVPLASIDALGGAGKRFDGQLSAVATLGGTLSELSGKADVELGPVRIGPASLPPSRATLTIEPSGRPSRDTGKTACGNARATNFDRAEYDKDLSDGAFRLDGALFDGQVVLDGLAMSRQRKSVVTGKARLDKLDLGTLANLVPGVALAGGAPKGSLSASLDVKKLHLGSAKDADVTLALEALEIARKGTEARLVGASRPIRLTGDELEVPELRLRAKSASGLAAELVAGGLVHKVTTSPELDVSARVEPIDLSRLSADLPELARASGTLTAALRLTGPPSAPRTTGDAHVRRAELALRGSPLALEDLNVDVVVGGGELVVERASARLGLGTVEATARMPIRGLELGTATAAITARGVKLPVSDGVDVVADADLSATFRPGAAGEGPAGERNLPAVKGTVALTQFRYTRPITMNVDLGQLTGRSKSARAVETYDPADDLVRFDVTVVSPKPLRFTNNLADMALEITPPGLVLSGTNQRFGARGALRVLPDSKLQLRASEFDVREGTVRFDDPYRIAPMIDLRAQTEYRRYASTAAEQGAAPGASAAASSSAGTAGGSTGGNAGTSGLWRIQLHAHGDVDNLAIDLTSDPPLGKEDILLLLTIGMTRAELDRGLASTLGESAGLEALTTLTGADKAVKTIVPLIDDFRFGTGYSSRSGRTEPTVTLGKRLTDRLRASVTTGLSEAREVRSSIEWKVGPRVSVQGSYDNANDASSSSVGNIGTDLRFRLEFE
jgi:translocation and assembly module TamB